MSKVALINWLLMVLVFLCVGAGTAIGIPVANADATDYDANGNGLFEREEVIAMVADYLRDKVTKEDVLAILIPYFIDSSTYFLLDVPMDYSSDSVTFVPGASTSPSPTSTFVKDRAALAALYEAMDGPNWENNDNWLSDEPIHSWYGVLTSHHGRVIKLSLFNNGLTGEIPAALGGLSYLGDLNLSDNGLTGEIPAELSNLSY